MGNPRQRRERKLAKEKAAALAALQEKAAAPVAEVKEPLWAEEFLQEEIQEITSETLQEEVEVKVEDSGKKKKKKKKKKGTISLFGNKED